MVSLLRTIRLDASDAILFQPAAEPGEWAVTGGFLFHGRRFESLTRKDRVAFRSAFLGIDSFGFSTLAVVTPATQAEVRAATECLAAGFVARLGAPDLETARRAAADEIAFAADLCRGHDQGRLIALHREEGEDGQITERFRALRPREGSVWAAPGMAGHERPFQFIETGDPAEEDPAGEDPAGEAHAADADAGPFDIFSAARGADPAQGGQ